MKFYPSASIKDQMRHDVDDNAFFGFIGLYNLLGENG